MISISPRELAHFSISLGAMQKPEEFESLIALVDKHLPWVCAALPRVIVEIGAGKGGTSWAWSKLGASKLIVIDLPNGPWGGGDIMPMMEYIKQNTSTDIDVILGNSQNSECVAALKERLRDGSAHFADEEDAYKKIDFLFIDGAHDYAGVKTDFLTYSPFVRSGGIIAFHDICEHPPDAQCEVKKFWDELKETAKDPIEFIAEPKNWGGIGVIRWSGETPRQGA